MYANVTWGKVGREIMWTEMKRVGRWAARREEKSVGDERDHIIYISGWYQIWVQRS